ncbi:unnamed protein product [Linum tenue]|uniref:Uncharacterized protein n=1 Tax=Linum tenue TaxID=586396 RepID=A0AAV0IYB0_9ROSI|nr:unnamed protein product [Linum tenue]
MWNFIRFFFVKMEISDFFWVSVLCEGEEKKRSLEEKANLPSMRIPATKEDRLYKWTDLGCCCWFRALKR